MATASYTVTKAWSQAVAGAKDVNLQAPGASGLLYIVAGSLPADGAACMFLQPQETHPVTVAGGENLYLRLPNSSAADSLKAVATDA